MGGPGRMIRCYGDLFRGSSNGAPALGRRHIVLQAAWGIAISVSLSRAPQSAVCVDVWR